MTLSYFAHNGIDHTNGMEAAAHGANTLPWVMFATAVTIVIFYLLKRSASRRQPEEVEEEEE